ncbi:MAG: glycosyltransferase family 1 protein, partial [Candidatus Gracilibacteria bacterium]|nr:glycosyltransferase family 1 protein [Candidatus Gracilibacteria bacterium]
KMHHRIAYNLVIKSITRRAKKIIAISKNTKKDIIEILNIKESAIEVIYNGISLEDFYKVEDEREIINLKNNLKINREYFLYTGVWREHKNLSRLVSAFAEAVKAGIDVDLVIAGKEDLTYHEVRDAIVENNLQSRVHLVGFVAGKELRTLYSGALAYVFPSLYEGFGLPILEAMASEIPVICSNNSSCPEIAGEGNALFFNPTSLESIKNAMLEITKNEKLRNELVRRGKERVKDFSWDKMGKEVLEIYRTVI